MAFEGACLGSCRLSILDLSPAGHMPMSDSSRRWWITYNGEIYNFRDLRTELESLGHSFGSATDTEVVLPCWMEWGEGALDRLVGMFAFALYDARDRKLVLARDRYGIKPLYFLRWDDRLLFSSEAKALMQLDRPPRVNQQRLHEWLLYRNPDALTPDTLIDDIESVMPGELLEVRPGREPRRAKYYESTTHVKRSDFESNERLPSGRIVDELDEALNEAVRQRLVSDVPVGTLCSGGLDSSLITAMAAQYTRDLTAFHVSIAEAPSLDERKWVTELTNQLHIPLATRELDGQGFRENLTRAVYFSDWPLTHPNSVAYLAICELARQQGVIVLLTGEGADELFGGYSWSYRRLRYLHRLQPVFDLLPGRVRNPIAMASYAMVGLPVSSHRFRESLPSTIALADRSTRAAWSAQCEQAYAFVPRAVDRVLLGKMLADLSDFLVVLLRRLDRMSMATSVECRVPFLDHRVIHRAINLPLRYRLRGRTDKWALRQVAGRYIPRQIAKRSKMGFPLPLAAWLAPLQNLAFFEEGFCEQNLKIRRRGLERIVSSGQESPFAFFGLLTLEIWGRLHVLEESVEEVDTRLAELAERNLPVAGSS